MANPQIWAVLHDTAAVIIKHAEAGRVHDLAISPDSIGEWIYSRRESVAPFLTPLLSVIERQGTIAIVVGKPVSRIQPACLFFI